MIAALFALAAAMLIAGVTAVVEGFPYVRLESGMAMVYGGSVVGSSGVLLFGLAVVATWLRRVEKALRLGQAPGAVVAAPPVREARNPDIDPLRNLTASTLGGAGSGALADRSRIEPSLAAAPEVHVPSMEPAPSPAEPELPVPGVALPHPADEPAREGPKVAETVKAEAADDLFVPSHPAEDKPEPVPALGSAGDEAPLRSSLDEAPAAAPERTVVGRYSSGGNTYLMFDDGTIEADTPNGRFNFASLDELKAFVDGGGEAGARGAA